MCLCLYVCLFDFFVIIFFSPCEYCLPCVYYGLYIHVRETVFILFLFSYIPISMFVCLLVCFSFRLSVIVHLSLPLPLFFHSLPCRFYSPTPPLASVISPILLCFLSPPPLAQSLSLCFKLASFSPSPFFLFFFLLLLRVLSSSL